MVLVRLLLLLALFSVPVFAAAPTPTPEAALAALEKDLQIAQAQPGSDPALLDKVRARLEAIRHELNRLQQAEERAKAAKQLEHNGSDELTRALAKARDNLPMPVLTGLSVERLTALLQQAVADEQAAQQRVEAANRALSEAEQRGQDLRQASLQPFKADPLPPVAQGEPPLLARANQLLVKVRQQAMEAESKALALEQSTQPLALQLAQARQLQAQHELEQLRKRRERIETTLNEQRLAEAEAASLRAGQRAESERYPALKRLAEGNQEWADRLTKMTQLLGDITRQRDTATRRTEAMRQDMLTLRQRLDQLGLGPVIGNLLLQKRSELPTEADLSRRIKSTRALVDDIQLLDLDVTNARAALSDPKSLTNQLLSDAPAEEWAALEPSIQRLMREREDILQRLDALKPALLLAINDLEFALESERRTMREFSHFIAQNLLWMPNARPLWSSAWADYKKSLLTLFDLRRTWQELRTILWELAAQPLANLITFAPILALLALHSRLRRRIRLLADHAFERPKSTDQERIGTTAASLSGEAQRWSASATLSTTLGAIVLVFLHALPWPFLALLLGLYLQAEAPPGGFVEGIGQALAMLAPPLLYARIALALFHPNGLAERHFGWSPQTLHAMRQAVRLFIFGVLPFAFLAKVAIAMDTEAMRDGVGRLAFMLALLGLMLMLGRLLHPRGGMMLYWRMTHTRHWSARLAPLWFVLGIALPILFAVLAAVGYFYSADILTQKLVTSLWVVLGLVVVYNFGLRALHLVQHRLQLEREQAPPPPIKTTGSEKNGLLVPSNGMDVEQISHQSRKLLNFSLMIALLFALYAVWAPIFPALGIFEKIVLWDYRGEIKGETVTISVSLGDLLLSVFGLLAMWVAARNLPGLMEIILERWTSQDAGTRYAVITITRYLIIAIGLVLILGSLGLQWSQMQWLVAALGVGIGFGLQEIFANFVSGLIILFERPVRVGDMVSIGDKTGHIKRIHIRATVLEDFDRREIIIPNKKLITEEVANWTLSDTSTRVVVDVGVAYGSDPREVANVLREAAGRVPGLIQDPPPGVWFIGFGDSALNFRLRAFVADAEQRTETISELYYSIEYALREKGISIPFPQRDIHIRSIEGLNGLNLIPPHVPKEA